MNSAALVAKKMRDMSIKDEDILTSKAFGSYMETLLSIPCKAIRRRVPKVNMQAPEDEPQALGCTRSAPFAKTSGSRFFLKNSMMIARLLWRK